MKTPKSKKYPARAKDAPATQGMLHAVRDELISRMSAMELRSDAKFLNMESKIERVQAEVHRVALLVEEQNAKNNVVLEGLVSLFHRQERVERDVGDIKQVLLKAK